MFQAKKSPVGTNSSVWEDCNEGRSGRGPRADAAGYGNHRLCVCNLLFGLLFALLGYNCFPFQPFFFTPSPFSWQAHQKRGDNGATLTTQRCCKHGDGQQQQYLSDVCFFFFVLLVILVRWRGRSQRTRVAKTLVLQYSLNKRLRHISLPETALAISFPDLMKWHSDNPTWRYIHNELRGCMGCEQYLK